jgi:hypothetical protein
VFTGPGAGVARQRAALELQATQVVTPQLHPRGGGPQPATEPIETGRSRPQRGVGDLTNGGVASTVRAAHVLGYEVQLLADGCADMRPELHELALGSLAAGVCELSDCAQAVRAFDAYAAQSATTR